MRSKIRMEGDSSVSGDYNHRGTESSRGLPGDRNAKGLIGC